ncbi:MAG: DHH family phosphoesterase, partial [Planctomycetota bacterium]
QLGMKVVVTDHHAVTSLPPEVPVIHPGREDDPSPFPGLAGVGVAYKLAWALGKELAGAERVSPGHREFLLRALALVALGTVADVVPLLGENRVLVSYGLRAFQGLRHVGLEALIAECGLDAGSIASEQVAFRLAPHINAAGRLGRAEDALELLLTDDAHRARSLARALAAANRRRKEIEREMLSACVERLDAQDLGEPSLPIVIEGRGWHAGVAGIVAARLVDRYQRPVFVIAVEDGLGRGSARSPASRPLTPLYDGARRHAISIGGHERAGGLTVEEGCIDELRSALEEAARASAGVSAGEEGPPVRRYDLDLAGDSIDLSLLSSIERLAPFGEGNPLPRFRVGGLSVDGSPRLVGRGEDHLAFRVRTGRRRLRAIHFNGARHARRLTREGPLTLIAELTLNRYRGSASVELRVLDYLES